MTIKLSDFEQVRKLVFKNGESEYVETQINGEVIFSNLDKEAITTVNDKVIEKLKKTTPNEELLYRMIPFITNIESDITLAKFKKMMESPSTPLIALSNALFEYIENIISMGAKLVALNKKSKKFEKDLKAKGLDLNPNIEEDTVNEVSEEDENTDI